MLARAWYREWRAWWWSSALALAAILVLVLATAGMLDGMERETRARVADFYTGDLRVTPDEAGAAPPGRFPYNTTAELDAARARLGDAAGGARVEARLETTYILSRRGLVEAYLTEDDQFGVALPGVASERDAYSVGVLVGLPLQDSATRDRLRPYLVAGAFPEAAARADDPVQVLMSMSQFRSMLDPAERERLQGAPTAGQLAALRMEVTAAHVDDSGPFKDIIRFPARVTGVYDSGIDALDRITLVTPMQDAARLLGAPNGTTPANVFTVHGGHPHGAARAAKGSGWVAEGPQAFTHRYLGQLVAVVRVLGLTLSSLLLVFPFFMVWVGLSQQLDRSRRELAVCRAIGLGAASVRHALVRLCTRVALLAVLPATAVLLAAAVLLPRLLGPGIDFPFPLGFHVPPWAVGVTVANLAVAGAIALGGALRRHHRADLASTLRSL